MSNTYNFVDVRDVFGCPWFNKPEKRTEEYMEYCTELNLKRGWTLDTVYEMLMKETA